MTEAPLYNSPCALNRLEKKPGTKRRSLSWVFVFDQKHTLAGDSRRRPMCQARSRYLEVGEEVVVCKGLFNGQRMRRSQCLSSLGAALSGPEVRKGGGAEIRTHPLADWLHAACLVCSLPLRLPPISELDKSLERGISCFSRSGRGRTPSSCSGRSHRNQPGGRA